VFNGRDPVLPTRFALAETAAGVLGAIGIAAAEVGKMRGGPPQEVRVDVRHAAAALNSFRYHRIVDGMDPAAMFGAAAQTGTTAIYPTKDGRYFHTHGSFDPAGMCAAIGVQDPTPEKMASAVASWDGLALENRLAELGHCGAMVRSEKEWAAHPHGQALAQVPVVEVLRVGDSDPEPLERAERPLAGIRVLDLTRVLAGPTCARTLAEHGADVLKVGAKHLPTIEHFDLDTGHGKRWAHLNLKETGDRDALRSLVGGADVFSEGYRPGVMRRLGFGAEQLHELRPGIINVSINCYGHDGPFAGKPGWEQLGQSVSGMAFEEGGADAPRLVPAAACDYTTGYLAALGTLVAILRRAREGGSYRVQVSLARTGMWYMRQARVTPEAELPDDVASRDAVVPFMTESVTHLGTLLHLAPVVDMSKTPPHWALPSPQPGSCEPIWRS
jgi:crotonobetainyl-CoA:carnitine CoA-transferase CaiB-like acyl-CoA transferase